MFQYRFNPEVYKMLKSFYLLSGLRIGIHDVNSEICLEYPVNPGEYAPLRFCDKVRAHSESFKERCASCDLNAIRIVMESGKPRIYRCHAGFLEALIPIIINGEPICTLMIGQTRDSKDKQSERLFEDVVVGITDAPALANPAVLDDLKKTFDAMPIVDEERFAAMVNFLEICAGAIFDNRWINRQSLSLSEAFIEYVDAHLYSDISITDTARTLGFSTSHLSRVIANDLNTTFTDYVTQKRIEKAKELLANTSTPIKRIAFSLQFHDPAYFMRVFKKRVGMTCTEYRKQMAND